MAELPKPRLRGVSHQVAFFVAAVAGALLVLAVEDRIPVAIYWLSLCAMLGTSATYHRGTWSPRALLLLRRLDHSMIYVLVAGTYTPIVVLTLDGTLEVVLLAVAWAGALGGIVLACFWLSAPRWLAAASYVALGWIAVFAMPPILDKAGVAAFTLIVIGGVLYTVGAVVYARKRPDPSPSTFGFHEVFHAFVLAAAAAHFVAVAITAG